MEISQDKFNKLRTKTDEATTVKKVKLTLPLSTCFLWSRDSSLTRNWYGNVDLLTLASRDRGRCEIRCGSQRGGHVCLNDPEPACRISKVVDKDDVKRWAREEQLKYWQTLLEHEFARRTVDQPSQALAKSLISGRTDVRLVSSLLTGYG